MKCIVKGCENYKGQGTFKGDICAPCYDIIITGNHCPTYGILKDIGLTNRYQDILPEILNGREYRHDDSDWMIMEDDGSVSTSESGPIEAYTEWIIDLLDSNKWELKPKEIYVWGACDSDGLSVVSSSEDSTTMIFGDERRPSYGLKDNLFPKNKPKRYRLVEDNE